MPSFVKFKRTTQLLSAPISDSMDIYILTPKKTEHVTRDRIVYVLRAIRKKISYMPFFLTQLKRDEASKKK